MKLGLYCGTFNPFHIGHLNIVQKAQRIFDQVRVAKGFNPEKVSIPRTEPGVKSGFLTDIVKGVSMHIYTCLTTDYIQQVLQWEPGVDSVTLIRGIRNGNDYDYEMNQISVMRDMYPELSVVLIPCDREFAHISSTMIRSLDKFSMTEARKYLP